MMMMNLDGKPRKFILFIVMRRTLFYGSVDYHSRVVLPSPGNFFTEFISAYNSLTHKKGCSWLKRITMSKI